ncbi:sulfurtransferase [Demequina lutea]|uniref:Thiosulfate/3-mercaptopyruvate sulfurtransferase n=1 Tax=Demequina lutea TaxID=431489 RepID=A0A7Z0CKN1_9MICO|nr:sulfurtransferase [Demequina lutea]NYI41895.1 thiosulfate/3-mercaptopyruvate sulfurtransferase [Demequina lutea]
MSVLISVDELVEELASADAPRVLDVRWSLAVPDGRPAYAQEHLPEAIYVDLNEDLAAPPSTFEGRHPLPTQGSFERAARAWGLADGEAVVVYDDAAGMAAARAWWLLRHAGVRDVRILDGGLAAWRAAHAPLESGEIHPVATEIELSWGHMPVVDADGAALDATEGVLLDARAGERYRGETEPIDPRAGHIPGGISAPTQDNLGEAGTFLAADALRSRFGALGVDGSRPVAVYCGSGVTAAHEIAALAEAGFAAALYPGSWSQWSNDAERRVATGAEPDAGSWL